MHTQTHTHTRIHTHARILRKYTGHGGPYAADFVRSNLFVNLMQSGKFPADIYGAISELCLLSFFFSWVSFSLLPKTNALTPECRLQEKRLKPPIHST